MIVFEKGETVSVDGRVGWIGYILPAGYNGTVPAYKINFPNWTGCYAVHSPTNIYKLVKVPGTDCVNLKPGELQSFNRNGEVPVRNASRGCFNKFFCSPLLQRIRRFLVD